MNFPNTIKCLRKQKNLTQEDLAEQLNTSFQTVSKWENGVSMPDISMLPVLADYFHITIDELLGHSASDRQAKAATIVQEAHALADQGHLREACAYLEKETQYYQMDVRLQSLMGAMAYQCAKVCEGQEKQAYLRQAVKQAEWVMKLDQNDSSRTAQARMLKCYCLRDLGDQATAMDLADRLPSMFSSREVALFRCAQGAEKQEYATQLMTYLEELREEVMR